MDDIQNNQPTQPTPVAESDAQPEASPSQQAPSQTTPSPKNGNRSFLLIIILILVFIAGFAVFFTMYNQNTATPPATLTSSPTQTPSAAPTIATGSSEEQEVENIDVEDTSPTEIPAVEQDLQGL